MRLATTTMLFGALLASALQPRQAFADAYDGNWSVVVITERGTCDRAYRYAVRVTNGQVVYSGDAKGVYLAGMVTPNGHVSVSISLRNRSAEGTGRLSNTTGAGSWHGNGANNTTCAGTWEAERR